MQPTSGIDSIYWTLREEELCTLLVQAIELVMESALIMTSILGGMAGLVLCLFAKFNEWRYSRGNDQQQQVRQHVLIIIMIPIAGWLSR